MMDKSKGTFDETRKHTSTNFVDILKPVILTINETDDVFSEDNDLNIL